MNYQTSREQVLAVLGGKCRRCGWSEHAAALGIVKAGETSRAARKGKGTEKYYLDIGQELNEGCKKYTLLCLNCQAVLRKIAKPSPVLVPQIATTLVVWYSTSNYEDTFKRNYQWLDKELGPNRKLLILWQDELYQQDGTPYDGDWNDLCNLCPTLKAANSPEPGLNHYQLAPGEKL